MHLDGEIRIGTAGWTIPRAHAGKFPSEGSSLARYAVRFSATEINSSFHRPHRPESYRRWAESVPADFRFAVKVPKEITHARKLVDCVEPLDRFLGECGQLGDKLGPLLVQLPPSLELDFAVARGFFELLRRRVTGPVVCEPRHPTWFGDEGDDLLRRMEVARVGADPARIPEAAVTGGWSGLIYYRLHGSPRTYFSSYPSEYLDALALRLAEQARGGTPVWCIFDNTASGAAAGDALRLLRISRPEPRMPSFA